LHINAASTPTEHQGPPAYNSAPPIVDGIQLNTENEELQQVYAIEQPDRYKLKPQLCLAGTAAIPLARMKANITLLEEHLQLRMIGVS